MMLGNTGAFVGAASRFSARSYAQDGLVAMYDAIENAGWGVHDPNATVWKNLVENSSYADFDIKSGGTWTGNGFAFNGFAAQSKAAWPSFNNLDLVYRLDSAYVDFAPNFKNRMRWFIGGGGAVFSGVAGVSHKVYAYPYFKYGNALTITTQYSGDDISKLYVNGSFVEPTGQKTQHTDVPAKPCIGVRQGVSSSYNTGKGVIWRIAVYSRALTSEEVAKNHAIDVARFNLNWGGA